MEVKVIKHLGIVCFMLIIGICFINCASASDVDSLNENLTIDDASLPENTPVIQNFTINSDNIYEYFDDDGVLLKNYSNSIFYLEDDIQNFGIIEISVDNVTFIGNDYNLKNTVFFIAGNNVTLCNFSMELYHAFEDIEGAGIYIDGNDVTIDGVSLDYFVPAETRASGIYAEAVLNPVVRNLRIANCNVFFVANNVKSNVNNYAVSLKGCYNATVENNVFTGSFPLKDVIYGADGTTVSSETVYIFGIVDCDQVDVVSNTFIANVEDRNGNYPTLDGIFIIQSTNCNILKNNLSMFDFITLSGVDNYLYGIDVHRVINLTIEANNVHIETTGGKLTLGTAYPIQLSGPYSNITIVHNDLFSRSNGPNLGIYSMNYYGRTNLNISHNNINVTGLAGEHEWALVAGIETQDDYAYIVNNTIEVHSIREVGENDNLYGISYRQKTEGNHTQFVSDNVVFSDGLYSVYMLSTKDSTITNNILISTRDDIKYGYGGYKAGPGSHTGDTIYNNRIINYYDYFGQLYNYAVGERTSMYRYQENVNERTNEFDGTGMTGKTPNNPNYNSNPTKSNSGLNYNAIPGQGSSTSGNGDGTGNGNGNSNSGNNQNSGKNGNGGKYLNNNTAPTDEGGTSENSGLSWKDYVEKQLYSNTDDGTKEVNSFNGNVASNNTDSTPDIAGSDSAAGSSMSSNSASSDAGASDSESQPKAYEISKETSEGIPSTNIYFTFALMVLVLLLLVIGYRRKDSEEDY